MADGGGPHAGLLVSVFVRPDDAGVIRSLHVAGVLLATFIVIFPAELPDKSFIATLILGARYPKLWVWLGASLAFGIQMVIAVAAGQLLSLLPRAIMLGATALLFAVGAVLLLRSGLRAKAAGEQQEAQEEAEEERK